MAARYGRRLRTFLSARLRNSDDAPDLAQEVFLRLLRVERHDTIRSPEAYLFTVASHVLYQHALRESTRPVAIDLTDALNELHLVAEDDPTEAVERQQRLDAL